MRGAVLDPIIFHWPADWLTHPARRLPFYVKITAGLDARGLDWRAVTIDRDGITDRIDGMPGLHVVNHGRVRHPRAWNAGIAYVYPFWHLDPDGIRAFSSMAHRTVPPIDQAVDRAAARGFAGRLRKRLVQGRASRYEQPAEIAELPRAQAAVFLQSEGHRVVGETLWIDRWAMLETVLATLTGPVLVKPHPRDFDPATFARLEALAARFPQMVVTMANIHDVIAAADRVVTINSAVGIEAYLHPCPVILCGQADFHHVAVEARDVDALVAALRAPAPQVDYDGFLWWYFGQMCLNAGAPDLVDQFLARLGD